MDGNEAAESAPTQLPIGTVHMVDPDGKFVLIQSSRFLPVEAETPVTTVSSNGLETAQLKISPARKGQFITADIINGRPGIGDRAVMLYSPPSAAESGGPDAAGRGTSSEIQVLE